MPYPLHVKRLAHKLDPECWKSYSGKPIEFKRAIDVRRAATLKRATIIEARRAGLSAMRGALYGCGKFPFALAALRKSFAIVDERVRFFGPDDRVPVLIAHPTPINLEKRSAMPPMKIAMMLHFYAVCGPFAPEKCRTSVAYTTFVRELLRDGMIERPTKAQRNANSGWAYTTTDKGRVYVEALKAMPLPVQAEPQWIMPKQG